MVGRNLGELGEWLAAEREGREADADWQFGLLFTGLVPRRTPPDGFPDTVLAALRAAGHTSSLPTQPEPAWRRALALALLPVVAVMVAAGLPALVLDLRLHTLLLPLLRTTAAAAAFALSVGLEAAAVFLSVARALAAAAASGPVVIILTVNLALAFTAWCGLSRLLVFREEE